MQSLRNVRKDFTYKLSNTVNTSTIVNPVPITSHHCLISLGCLAHGWREGTSTSESPSSSEQTLLFGLVNLVPLGPVGSFCGVGFRHHMASHSRFKKGCWKHNEGGNDPLLTEHWRDMALRTVGLWPWCTLHLLCFEDGEAAAVHWNQNNRNAKAIPHHANVLQKERTPRFSTPIYLQPPKLTLQKQRCITAGHTLLPECHWVEAPQRY